MELERKPDQVDPEVEAVEAVTKRLGLRATAYKDRLPEIEITLDPNALPPVGEASEAVEGDGENRPAFPIELPAV